MRIMTKNTLKSEYKTCANMIKYIIIHNVYHLMNALNKLCLDFWIGRVESRKQAASVGLLYVRGIIAFQFVFKARMRQEEETETLHVTMKQDYFSLHHHRAHYAHKHQWLKRKKRRRKKNT